MAGTISPRAHSSVSRHIVSMESGLDGRNNPNGWKRSPTSPPGLNGVRPRWPEQFAQRNADTYAALIVSMESGLDGRNNRVNGSNGPSGRSSLNGVRPRWPEQSVRAWWRLLWALRLNGVRPRWPEQLDRLVREGMVRQVSQWSPA